MKKFFMSIVLLFSVAASYSAEQPRRFNDGLEELPEGQQQDFARRVAPRTNEEIMEFFQGASFMRDFLQEGDRLITDGEETAPVPGDAR